MRKFHNFLKLRITGKISEVSYLLVRGKLQSSGTKNIDKVYYCIYTDSLSARAVSVLEPQYIGKQ